VTLQLQLSRLQEKDWVTKLSLAFSSYLPYYHCKNRTQYDSGSDAEFMYYALDAVYDCIFSGSLYAAKISINFWPPDHLWYNLMEVST